MDILSTFHVNKKMQQDSDYVSIGKKQRFANKVQTVKIRFRSHIYSHIIQYEAGGCSHLV